MYVAVSSYYKTKLKGLYNTAMQDAEAEAEYVFTLVSVHFMFLILSGINFN